jgi:hypothetical protein
MHQRRRQRHAPGYRQLPAVIEINGIYDGDQFAGYRNVTQNERYPVTANRWNWPVAVALGGDVSRQTRRVRLLASYTREWNHMAGTWQPNDPAARLQPRRLANRGVLP